MTVSGTPGLAAFRLDIVKLRKVSAAEVQGFCCARCACLGHNGRSEVESELGWALFDKGRDITKLQNVWHNSRRRWDRA